MNIPDINAVKAFLLTLQDKLCQQLEHVDNNAKFAEQSWQHKHKGGGRSRILKHRTIFEQAGVKSNPPPNHHIDSPPGFSAMKKRTLA